MSIESREMDNPPPRGGREDYALRCKVAEAVWRVGSVTLRKMARDCGALPPPDHSEDAGRPWVPPEQERPKPCHPECSVCGPVFYGTGWPGQDSGAEGEI